jgi:thiol-disulfide isomerase/thioredoxin
MKRLLLFIAIFLFFLSGFSKPPGINADASEVLGKVLNKLTGLKTLSYTYKRVIDYPGEGYHDESTVDSYLDFEPSAQIIGLRYQFSNNDLLAVYNGSESFHCDKKEKTISVDNSPKAESFKYSSYLFNSYLMLKNALPAIIADNTIPKLLYDTTIANKHFFVADVILKNKTLNALGEYVPTTKELKFSYKLIIDKTSFMPVEVIQNTLNTRDLTKTQFTGIDLNPAAKTETSWYASSYDSYAPQKAKENIALIKAGISAPESSLTFFTDQTATAISTFKGKVVLLEFWIKDCGHCIEDAPLLNALYDKYKGKNFKLLAVNSHDTKNMIDFFVKKHSIKYDVLTGNKEIEKNYGISGFPAMVLIDKNGTVVYSAYGFDKKKLEEMIDQSI